MCGIVGYLGYRDARGIITDGLKRLEYRGYDSAGIALYRDAQLLISKTAGKVAQLEALMAQQMPAPGHVGMGHTRWATHGVPSDVNSHPHSSNSGRLTIVHNGIIENYQSLKDALLARGYTFESDTDTEVLVNLIEDVLLQDTTLKLGKAVQLAMPLWYLTVQNPMSWWWPVWGVR
jgi:glutamine---fructose-6-phosphate transaminase (isomerizing)